MRSDRPNHADVAAGSGVFDIAQTGEFIRVTGRGFWTVEDIDEHFAKLKLALDAARRATGAVMVLVDLQDAPVQSTAVTDRLGWWTTRTYLAQDRVAIVLASSLLKAQMRRIPMAATRELFLSPMAALTWLMAGSPRHIAARAA